MQTDGLTLHYTVTLHIIYTVFSILLCFYDDNTINLLLIRFSIFFVFLFYLYNVHTHSTETQTTQVMHFYAANAIRAASRSGRCDFENVNNLPALQIFFSSAALSSEKWLSRSACLSVWATKCNYVCLCVCARVCAIASAVGRRVCGNQLTNIRHRGSERPG